MASNLIQRVQESTRSQKNNFCSRSTRVTTIGDTINLEDEISYVDCDRNTQKVLYVNILNNNGYINDCVQGGCSIKSTTEKFGNRYFVEFGTTDCNTPPPSDIRLLVPCGTEQGIPVDVLGYDVTEGGVYQIQLIPLEDFPDVTPNCYTIGEQTSSPASYDISGQVLSIGDCFQCGRIIP